MFDGTIRLAFKKPFLVLVLVSAGAALGVISFEELKRDVFPDLSAPVFNVIVQNPAIAAEELETAIAIPMEVALAGLPDVRRIRSTNQLGVSQVTVEFDPDADYYRSRQLVAERLAQVAPQLPPGTEPPLISSLSGRLNEIMEITLSAAPGAADLMALRDLAEFEVKNRLLAVPGVAAVERLGGYLRQFQIQVDPDRMAARGVALEEILHAAEGANLNAAGGFFGQGSIEWTIRAVGRIESVDELRTTVVAVRGATPILLGEVADVLEAPAVRRGLAHRLQGEVVQCRIIKQFGADTVRVAEGVRRAIADLERTLPRGVEIKNAYDQSALIDSALGGVGRAVLYGAGLVVLVIFALLGDLRAALLVTLTIPLAIALAGVLLKRLGVGLNTMTLGGLAIAVGLLVDASIILTENVVHRLTLHRESGSRRVQALAAALEVGRPIAFATLIVIAVFLPLFGISGIEGRMYQPLAAAVIATMAASLVLALTLTPSAAGLFLRARPEGRAEDVWIIRALKSLYAPLLDVCLRRPALVRVFSLAATAPAMVLAFFIGSDFMPKLDEGALMVNTTLPAEASLEEVDRLNHRFEDALRTFPEVVDVIRRTGRAEGTEDPMPHTLSDVLVVLKPNRKRSIEELTQAMREAVEQVPAVSALFTTPLGMRIDEGLGGSPADISVRIFGPDLETLGTLAVQAKEIMGRVRGLTDLVPDPVTGLPQIRIAIDRLAVARAGLTPGDVIHAFQVGMVGEKVSEVWIGQRRYDLVVKLQEHRRSDIRAIQNLPIDSHESHDGASDRPRTRIPLGHLAAITETTGPVAIRHEAGTRRIAIAASVAGRDLGRTAAEVRRRLEKELPLPPGYFFDVGGKVESQARSSRALLAALTLAVVAVFILLYLALGSSLEVLAILLSLPIAFVGAIVALWLARETWNVSSLVGLCGLFGIAVQNGLVLVAQTRALEAAGSSFRNALREACLGRLRPKVMTAATAILGLLPLLVLHLSGTEIERPLAVVMTGGLVSSTLFTLLALPTFLMLAQAIRERSRRLS